MFSIQNTYGDNLAFYDSLEQAVSACVVHFATARSGGRKAFFRVARPDQQDDCNVDGLTEAERELVEDALMDAGVL